MNKNHDPIELDACSISNEKLAHIAGGLAAQAWLDSAPFPLSSWRKKHLADFEHVIGGCEDTPARLGAWAAGFEQAVLCAIDGKKGCAHD